MTNSANSVTRRDDGPASVPSAMRHNAQSKVPPTLQTIPARDTQSFRDLRRHSILALIFLVVFAGGIGLVVGQTVIAGAVVASGVLVVETGGKLVQHLAGGIVSAILVREGQTVVAGQPLVLLDQTVLKAELNSTTVALAQQKARLARLFAERDALTEIDFSSLNGLDLTPTQLSTIQESELTQFKLRRAERDGERQQIAERIIQTKLEIEGQEVQLAALRADILLVEDEIERTRSLVDRQLLGTSRAYDLDRTLQQQRGAEGTLVAGMAANRGKIAELELLSIQVDQTLRSQLTDQIAEAQAASSKLADQLIVARLQAAQAEIVAPQSGRILQMEVHTVGGVVRAGETLMTIVPDSDRLLGEVRISPADIDQLFPGQPVTLQFSAFDRGTTPSLNGHLDAVSPDLIQDQHTGALYYVAHVAADDGEVAKLENLKLVPGMPIEVFIRTGDRTIVSYLTKPLLDQVRRAFRG